MADTDECAHRACLRMADVTVMHSVTTSETGSTATRMDSFGRAIEGVLKREEARTLSSLMVV